MLLLYLVRTRPSFRTDLWQQGGVLAARQRTRLTFNSADPAADAQCARTHAPSLTAPRRIGWPCASSLSPLLPGEAADLVMIAGERLPCC